MSGCMAFADKAALTEHAAAQWLELLAKGDVGIFAHAEEHEIDHRLAIRLAVG